MREQLWPLYILAGIFGLYTLWSILRNLYYAYLMIDFIDTYRPSTKVPYDTNENTSLNTGETL